MRRSARAAWGVVTLAHLATVGWLFSSVFTAGRLLYFRDLSTQYAPAYSFTEAALRSGIWPLWNPTVNAGQRFLLAYPVDLALLALGGWKWCLGVGAALHLLLAMIGCSRLARSLGAGPWGAWTAGAVYGVGGLMLSMVNLVQLFQASAWAPWVIAACVRACERPTARRTAVLAVLAAVQVSTLGAEIVLQTAIVAAALCGHRLGRWRSWAALVGAAGVAGLVAAPVLLGVRSLMAGSARQSGFPIGDALAFSLHPWAILDVVLPRWLGDAQAFTDASFWGRTFFPSGFPYFLTLYLGLPVLCLASQSCRYRRLWLLVALGALVALGQHGPLGLLPDWVRSPVRGPQKAFFLCHLSLALLAGFGVERRAEDRAVRVSRWLGPAVLLLLTALALIWAPTRVHGVLSGVVPSLSDPRGLLAARAVWPAAWLLAGALTCATVVALARGGRIARLAAVAAVVDLLAANGAVNQFAPRSFYDLRPGVAALLEPVRRTGGRIFSYGVAQTPALQFAPGFNRPRTPGFTTSIGSRCCTKPTSSMDSRAPSTSTGRVGRPGVRPCIPTRPRRSTSPPTRRVSPAPGSAGSSRSAHSRLSWPHAVGRPGCQKSFRNCHCSRFGLPCRTHSMLRPSRSVRVKPDVAVWSVRASTRRPASSWKPARRRSPLLAPFNGEPTVRYRRLDAHSVRVEAKTPPGLIVVLDGFDDGWTASEGEGAGETVVPLLEANDRFLAMPTSGGEHVYTLRFRPRWLRPALAGMGVGLAGLALLALGCVRFHRTSSTVAC